MVNDPIGDMLIQIKNAVAAGRKSVDIPCSNMKAALAEILVGERYIESVKKTGVAPKFILHMVLIESAISGVKRVSKPGLRWYIDKNAIPRVFNGMGTAIISTSKGLMTGRAAKKLGIGGELLCEIW
ncbi:MAG: 30S ribosomal protein S8 [Candidatus Gottesmanbacteria bacterium]